MEKMRWVKKKIPQGPRPRGIILSIVGFNLIQKYTMLNSYQKRVRQIIY